MELLKLDLGAGTEVYVDAVDVTHEGSAVPASARRPLPIDEAVKKLEGAIAVVGKSGRSLIQAFREMDTDQATLKMGVGFTTEGTIFIAKAGASVNFEVTFTWKTPTNRTTQQVAS